MNGVNHIYPTKGFKLDHGAISVPQTTSPQPLEEDIHVKPPINLNDGHSYLWIVVSCCPIIGAISHIINACFMKEVVKEATESETILIDRAIDIVDFQKSYYVTAIVLVIIGFIPLGPVALAAGLLGSIFYTAGYLTTKSRAYNDKQLTMLKELQSEGIREVKSSFLLTRDEPIIIQQINP
jgi:hypothetical protein